MSLTTRVLVALVAGLAIGVGISAADSGALFRAVQVVEPIGALWVNAIRMTVVPLVVSLLVTGIASNTPGTLGRVGGRSLGLFVTLVAAGALFTAVVAPPLLSLMQFDAESFADLRAGAAGAQAELPPFRDWGRKPHTFQPHPCGRGWCHAPTHCFHGHIRTCHHANRIEKPNFPG